MKMIRAIVRPDAADTVTEGLAEAGFFTMTKINAFGRGKQKGITVGEIHYDELPKTLIMDGDKLVEVNPFFEAALKKAEAYSPKLMRAPCSAWAARLPVPWR